MKLRLTAALCALLLTGPIAFAADLHDGAHDFDFNIGTWHTHIKRLTKPLTGSTETIEMNGTVTVRKVWDGRAQLEEIEADSPNGHWQGMTLFLYDPHSRQWNQTFADSESGQLQPPLIGSLKDGKVELYSQEVKNGRAVLIRASWFDIKPDSHHFEESFSDDGGRSWEAVFNADLTRLKS